MAELEKEDYGPHGDASRHLPMAELDAGLAALPVVPKDAGRLRLIVRRRADGVREAPESVCLSADEGVPGDGWSRRPPRKPDAQLAVMNHGIAKLIANGQPLTLFGDNRCVDLAVAAASLPFGTRLRVGEAVVEMTPEPHDGCYKFNERFGNDALKFVQGKATRHQNRRGVYWKVIDSGAVCVGSAVEVLSRN